MFAEGQFRALIATIVFSAALFWLVWIDVNPASDLVQITAAMITLLIVHINLQHFQDRVTPLPTLLSLGDWIRTLAAEPQPGTCRKDRYPGLDRSRQKSAAVKVMQKPSTAEDISRSGRDDTRLLRANLDGDAERQPHLTLQTLPAAQQTAAECCRAATKTDMKRLACSLPRNGYRRSMTHVDAEAGSPEAEFPRSFRTASSWTWNA